MNSLVLIDTNVLVYAVNGDDPRHRSSRGLLKAVAEGRVPVCVFPQNLLEFYAVITDPRRVPHPLSPGQAMDEIAKLRTMVPVVAPNERSLDALACWASAGGPRGSDIYDVYIVAQMEDAGIKVICTYNLRDFEAFHVKAATPEQVMQLLGIPLGEPDFVQDRPRFS